MITLYLIALLLGFVKLGFCKCIQHNFRLNKVFTLNVSLISNSVCTCSNFVSCTKVTPSIGVIGSHLQYSLLMLGRMAGEIDITNNKYDYIE